MKMTFKEFFHLQHPELNGKWGFFGELLHEALERQMESAAEYIDIRLKEKKCKCES